MPDDPAQALRRANMVVIPAVLVRQGDDPTRALRGLMGNPVEIPCRIEMTAPSAPAALGNARSRSPAVDDRTLQNPAKPAGTP